MQKTLEQIITQALLDNLKPDNSFENTVFKAASKVKGLCDPLISSLAVANKHNHNLTQDIIRLEGDIIELKQFIDKHAPFPHDEQSDYNPSDVNHNP